jgi:hypothetical protein
MDDRLVIDINVNQVEALDEIAFGGLGALKRKKG